MPKNNLVTDIDLHNAMAQRVLQVADFLANYAMRAPNSFLGSVKANFRIYAARLIEAELANIDDVAGIERILTRLQKTKPTLFKDRQKNRRKGKQPMKHSAYRWAHTAR